MAAARSSVPSGEPAPSTAACRPLPRLEPGLGLDSRASGAPSRLSPDFRTEPMVRTLSALVTAMGPDGGPIGDPRTSGRRAFERGPRNIRTRDVLFPFEMANNACLSRIQPVLSSALRCFSNEPDMRPDPFGRCPGQAAYRLNACLQARGPECERFS